MYSDVPKWYLIVPPPPHIPLPISFRPVACPAPRTHRGRCTEVPLLARSLGCQPKPIGEDRFCIEAKQPTFFFPPSFKARKSFHSMGGGKETGQKACLWSLETPIPHSGSTQRDWPQKWDGISYDAESKEDQSSLGEKKDFLPVVSQKQ